MLSRWAAHLVDGRWVVRNYAGTLAAEPNSFPMYVPALKRADWLNRREQLALAVRLNNEKMMKKVSSK